MPHQPYIFRNIYIGSAHAHEDDYEDEDEDNYEDEGLPLILGIGSKVKYHPLLEIFLPGKVGP